MHTITFTDINVTMNVNKKRLNHGKKGAFNITLILDSIRSLNSIKPIHPSLPRSCIFPCAVPATEALARVPRADIEL